MRKKWARLLAAFALGVAMAALVARGIASPPPLPRLPSRGEISLRAVARAILPRVPHADWSVRRHVQDLRDVGLRVGRITSKDGSHRFPKYADIIGQNPPSGRRVLFGTRVDLMTEFWGPTTTVPNVLGLLSADASAAIGGAGLVPVVLAEAPLPSPGRDEPPPVVDGDSFAIRQSPPYGTSVPYLSSVKIVCWNHQYGGKRADGFHGLFYARYGTSRMHRCDSCHGWGCNGKGCHNGPAYKSIGAVSPEGGLWRAP